MRIVLELTPEEALALWGLQDVNAFDGREWCSGYHTQNSEYPAAILEVDRSGGRGVAEFADARDAAFVAAIRNAVARALLDRPGGSA